MIFRLLIVGASFVYLSMHTNHLQAQYFVKYKITASHKEGEAYLVCESDGNWLKVTYDATYFINRNYYDIKNPNSSNHYFTKQIGDISKSYVNTSVDKFLECVLAKLSVKKVRDTLGYDLFVQYINNPENKLYIDFMEDCKECKFTYMTLLNIGFIQLPQSIKMEFGKQLIYSYDIIEFERRDKGKIQLPDFGNWREISEEEMCAVGSY